MNLCHGLTMSSTGASQTEHSARPRLLAGLPLLSRDRREVQFGHAVVLDCEENDYEQLRSLDGTRTVDEILAAAARPSHLAEVICALTRAGLIEDAGVGVQPVPRLTADTAHRTLRHGATGDQIARARAAAAVVVHGDGRIGIGVAAGLAAAGVGWVHLAASGRVRADDCGSGYRDVDIDRERAKVAATVLHGITGTVRTERLPATRAPDLVVLADSPAVAPGLAQSLFAARIPHLLTYPRGAIGVVGPLVLPGTTCCLRCLDLHRTDRDPSWPRLATQLAGRPQPTPLAVAAATVAAAVAQALLLIDGEPPGLPADSAVDIDPEQLTAERRVWARHPACSCREVRDESDKNQYNRVNQCDDQKPTRR